MKIFIGGMKRIHQIRFRKNFPNVEFVFSSFEDSEGMWVRRAVGADFILIDQSRCTHPIIQQLRKRTRIPIYLTDSKAILHNIVEELQAYGKTNHSHAHPAGSESLNNVPTTSYR